MIAGQIQIHNSLITESTAHLLEPEYCGRGYWNPDTGDFILNIPKNGSNTLSHTLCRPPRHWQGRNHLWEDFEITQYHVVYRDPVARWLRCLAEHLGHLVEYGATTQETQDFLYSRAWMAPDYREMHLFSQAAYCQGVPTSARFYDLSQGLTPVFQAVGVDTPERCLNNLEQDRNSRRLFFQGVSDLYQNHSDVRQHVDALTECDYLLFAYLNLQA